MDTVSATCGFDTGFAVLAGAGKTDGAGLGSKGFSTGRTTGWIRTASAGLSGGFPGPVTRSCKGLTGFGLTGFANNGALSFIGCTIFFGRLYNEVEQLIKK